MRRVPVVADLDWIIARHRFRVVTDSGDVPEPWQSLYPLYRTDMNAMSYSSEVKINVVVQPDWDDESPVSIEEDTAGDTWSLHVKAPCAAGRFYRTPNGYIGNFNVCGANEFGIYVLLRIASAMLAEDSGGMILHASGVWRNDRVWLFSGPSGAGKTTIATELVKGHGETFAEDQIVLTFSEDGSLMAHATPLGEVTPQRNCPSSGLVAGIYFLSHSKDVDVRQAGLHEAVSKLFAASRWGTRNELSTGTILGVIGQVVGTGLCRKLAFPRDFNCWEKLEEEVEDCE